MDLEQLTKHQIILLTLLVSLVTSIATGIVTVSLMNQAPQGVTRTINQIVEHTVQTVVPAATQGAAAATVTTKTVVVKDDDLTAQSIASVQKSIVRITARGGNDLIARGVIVDSKGTALTDSDSLVLSGATSFDAILSDGTRVPVTVISDATSTSIAVVNVTFGTSTAAAPATLADSTKLQLGQSIIRIGGKGVDTVGEGVIATLPSSDTY
jgi:S1-C subfamily serine protease